MFHILDNLHTIESAVPGLGGRLDISQIAAAGHSFGGQTAGILIATAGTAGSDFRPEAAQMFPWLNPDFSETATTAMVVAGDADISGLTTRGANWGTDPYQLSPGAEALLALFGAEHSLGGIPGYDAAETADHDPACSRVMADFAVRPATPGRIETQGPDVRPLT
ncbi:hypothetical protein [Gordonia rubripertincta]|uniref:Alpha/beta hydrolase family protein n=1 Tax=Gordonia rubripertincta TaxID=36822 RepID=A0ABT4MX61_GORRU|nr:hypothetical protein [Gordonia rubripertincta]MCZ4551409.1 hypothetical protein [Gordonia rubripertincta]